MFSPKVSKNFLPVSFSARSTSTRRTKKASTVEIPEAKRITQSWDERKEVWKSKFAYLQSKKLNVVAPDIVRFLQTKIDLSPQSIKSWYLRKAEENEDFDQAFNEERNSILGDDLAAAQFVVHRGGAIRFCNEAEWIRKKSSDDEVPNLPSKFVPALHVEAIDCRGMILRRPGVENILELPKLRWLSLAGNEMVDDWTMDAISGSYGELLQHLDISYCRNISHRALACFYRFRKIDTLVVEGIANSNEFKLACMMLEDIRPMLTIKGINHENLKQELLNRDNDLPTT